MPHPGHKLVKPTTTAAALKRSGQKPTPSNRPARYIAAETGTGTSRGRHGGTTPGSKTGGQAIHHAFTGSGFNKQQLASGRGKRGESPDRPRLYKYDGSKQSPLTAGDVFRSAAAARTSAARAKTIAAAKAKEKKRVASYKPKYRMGSRGGVRDSL
jgi:hypothetical protein